MTPDGFVITADTHIKKGSHDGTLRICLQYLDDLCAFATARGTRHIIVAGDFLDGANLDVLIEVYSKLLELNGRGFRFFLLMGNHEVMLQSNRAKTPLRLLSRVATVITSPKVVQGPGWVLWLVPWYGAAQYVDIMKAVADRAMPAQQQKVLVSHVGLREGRTSASNIQLAQPVRLAHLYPDVWDLVCLGDYHAHQFLADHVLYLGSPYEQNFGDRDCVGAWYLQLKGGVSLTQIPTPATYPKFRTWRVHDENGMTLPGYRQEDRHRIYARLDLTGPLARMYPEAEILPLHSQSGSDGGRMKDINEEDVGAVFEAWLQSKHSFTNAERSIYEKLGRKYLAAAQGEA